MNLLSAGETLPTSVYITMATAADLESLFQHARAASPESVDKQPYDTVRLHFSALEPQMRLEFWRLRAGTRLLFFCRRSMGAVTWPSSMTVSPSTLEHMHPIDLLLVWFVLMC